ncbi:hypothetical protein DL769_000894 [Monosporascus sp. CRB-8-3]|nr:hypothetical protein DL769_000894 [Monosporascus sp. CRB-8-3]
MPRRPALLGRDIRFASVLEKISPFLPPLNFITIHYAYFIFVSLAASVVFWGSSNPSLGISYVDSLFLVISAMTEAGLNTVNLSQMTTWQQVMLWLLIIIGSPVWVSIWTILVRKHAFERRFKEIRLRSLGRNQTRPTASGFAAVRELGASARNSAGRNLPISRPVDGRPVAAKVPSTPQDPPNGNGDKASAASLSSTNDSAAVARIDHVAFAEDSREKATSTSVAFEDAGIQRQVQDTNLEEHKSQPHRHPPRDKVGRNAQFHSLTSEERETLGGTEYRALKLLSVLVPLYSILWQFLGCIALGAWIANREPGPAEANAINPWWNGIFNGVSAFNNSGMSVLDANIIPYGSSYFVLIIMGAMILAGNTAYPIFLRLILWFGLKIVRLATYEDQLVEWKTTLEYIIKYPRRVYTNLFPARQTWWLLFMLFVLNGTDWIAFEVLNLGNAFLEQTPLGTRVIDGLFQALAVRSGGFYVVPIPTMFIGLQVLYMIMMYVSVYPVVVAMRHSNVYEERSLGIYVDHDYEPELPLHRRISSRSTASRRQAVGNALRRTLTAWHGVGAVPSSGKDPMESRVNFISHQIRGQLSHDLWWLVLAVLLICIIETKHFMDDPIQHSVFNVVFEVVSAYGCVGISVGVPYDAFSFSGSWYPGRRSSHPQVYVDDHEAN